jgi:predicted membrane channel-forming protein YqfA (hemolysin III family)
MFVALGLSAVVPVLHGVKMHGVLEMRDRIGLTWVVLQGVLYILGAGLYAVIISHAVSCTCANIYRLGGRRDHHQACMTFGEAHISFFMCLL